MFIPVDIILFRALLVRLGLLSVLYGLWLIAAPKKAIGFQVAFYRLINWRMEPMNMLREIRTTRAMGWTSVLCGLGAVFLGFH